MRFLQTNFPICKTAPPFLGPSNIPLNEYSTFYLPIPQMIDMWVVSTFRLLQILLLCTFVYTFFVWVYGFIFLSMYVGMELLNYMVTPCLTFCFPQHLCYLTFLQPIYKRPYISTSLPVFGIIYVFSYSHFSG